MMMICRDSHDENVQEARQKRSHHRLSVYPVSVRDSAVRYLPIKQIEVLEIHLQCHH